MVVLLCLQLTQQRMQQGLQHMPLLLHPHDGCPDSAPAALQQLCSADSVHLVLCLVLQLVLLQDPCPLAQLLDNVVVCCHVVIRQIAKAPAAALVAERAGSSILRPQHLIGKLHTGQQVQHNMRPTHSHPDAVPCALLEDEGIIQAQHSCSSNREQHIDQPSQALPQLHWCLLTYKGSKPSHVCCLGAGSCMQVMQPSGLQAHALQEAVIMLTPSDTNLLKWVV